jgi:hypothetical protein
MSDPLNSLQAEGLDLDPTGGPWLDLRLAELVEACEPFGRAGAMRPVRWNGTEHLPVEKKDSDRAAIFGVTWGDVRALSAALAKAKGEKT